MDEYVLQAVDALRRGGTLLYPTDTIWGIGCDASNAQAVDRLYAIKERDRAKSMLILASESQIVRSFDGSNILESSACGTSGLCGHALELLADARPTTVILPAALLSSFRLAPNLPAADGTIGVRVPRHEFCQRLLEAFGAPVVSTSANLSGQPSPACYQAIAPALRERVDCCLPDHPSFAGTTQPSRIIKLTPEGEVVIRG